MSDTKWRRLFVALNEAEIGIDQIVVKFVDAEKTHAIRMPSLGSLHPPYPYIDTIEFGPIELCAIEWIEIPEIPTPSIEGVPASAVKQDIASARALIVSLGEYPVEDSDSGLKIVGYVR